MTETTNNSIERPDTGRRSARVKRRAARSVATSLVLYVVIGTLATGIASAHAPNLNGNSRQSRRERAGVRVPARVNARAFKEFLAHVQALHASGQIKFDRAQEITITGEPRPDGTLENVSILSSPSQRRLDQLGFEFVRLVNEQRALTMLNDVERMRMHLRLDRAQVFLTVANEFASVARARQTEQSWNTLLTLGRFAKAGRPEGTILNQMRLSSSGKQLVMSLNMSRQALGNLLLKQVTPN